MEEHTVIFRLRVEIKSETNEEARDVEDLSPG
jgi:hypothetical protein